MYLGIDIGTTSICAVVLDDNGNIRYTVTKANDCHMDSVGCERTQDAEKIYSVCESIYVETQGKFNIESVGVSGQMHGILYVDKNGMAVSPLYSWQDERGNLPYENSTYAQTLSQKSGYNMATGFGCTSLYYDFVNRLIPQNAVSFCTIGDYVAMRLAGSSEVLMNATNAASLGLFDLKNGSWDYAVVEKLGMNGKLFPKVTADVAEIGKNAHGISVFTAVGDNQASVYGAEQTDDSVIVNIGTGSQLSVISNEYHTPPIGCEIRPYFNGKYIVLGCALCGGYSYRLLKDFFNSMFDGEEVITYSKMNGWAKEALDKDLPTTNTFFRGTRATPDLRASVVGLSEKNFNAKALTLSVLKGINRELKDFYDLIAAVTGPRGMLIGSGNAIRMNPVLRDIIENDYGMRLNIPAHKEEAAFGAALISAEKFKNTGLKRFVKYE